MVKAVYISVSYSSTTRFTSSSTEIISSSSDSSSDHQKSVSADEDEKQSLQDNQESKAGQKFKYSCDEQSTIADISIRTVIVNSKTVLLFKFKSTKISVEKQVCILACVIILDD